MMIQKAKLQRRRKYDNDLQHFDRPHPANAPEWAFVIQDDDIVFDTEIEQTKSDEDHVSEEIKEEVEEEVDARHSAVNTNQEQQFDNDSDRLEMDD